MCKACHSCIRILMMIFNFIFVLCGLGLFGLGLYFYLTSFFKNMGAEGTAFVIGFYVTMGIGAFTLIVGACGCCGAYHESPCLLGTYFIFLLLIFAAEIAAGVLVVLYKDKVKSYVGVKFQKGTEELKSKPDDTEHWMNGVQRNMKCCGYKGSSDYTKVPGSCCSTSKCEDSYTRGCESAWTELIQNNWVIFASILLGIPLIEILVMNIYVMGVCHFRSQVFDHSRPMELIDISKRNLLMQDETKCKIVLLLGLIFSMCLCCTARSIEYDMVETRA